MRRQSRHGPPPPRRPGRRSAASRSGDPSVARGRLSQKTSRAPRACAASATTSIAAALISVRYVPGAGHPGRGRDRRRARRDPSDPPTATTSAPCVGLERGSQAGVHRCGRRREERDPLPGHRLRRVRPEDRRHHRQVGPDLRDGGPHVVDVLARGERRLTHRHDQHVNTVSGMGPIPVTRLSAGRAADVTSTVRSAATGGRAAPDPSSSTRSGSSARAAATASATFDRNGAPASPEPHLRAPTVTTPARAASSR